ncbi:MAG: hypothetical protein ACRDHE_09745, partial [Ktedonobacterales bacterium]
MNAIRQLLTWVNAAPNIPITILYQPYSASTPVYLDVIAAAHSIPDDEDMWLRLQLEPVELVFLCRPGLRGDRVTLSNLVMNPGFESPAGGALAPALAAFSDTFATVDAYTLVAGSAPSVAANVMTVPAGTTLAFGSPAWGAIQTWQIRFKYIAGQTINLQLHQQNASNSLFAEIFTNAWSLNNTVGGTNHVLASATPSLTSGNWYWGIFTQFPSVAGDPPYIKATLYNDAAGSVGAQVVALASATVDAVNGLTGPCGIQVGGSAASIGGVGGGNAVQYVALFGPGAWTFAGNSGTGNASGAWDGTVAGAPTATNATCYPGGPVSSFGCARIDAAPAGTLNAQWLGCNNAGLGAIQQTAQPVATPGDVLGVSAYVRSSGVGAGCTQQILVDEFDATGAFLRQGSVAGATVTGAQAAWTQLHGAYTTGASCAYVALLLSAVDSTSGSVNGTVWWDNVQVWNETTTGQTSMPYCELRFPAAPCQLVVSGLLGDLPAPAWLAFGTYLT